MCNEIEQQCKNITKQFIWVSPGLKKQGGEVILSKMPQVCVLVYGEVNCSTVFTSRSQTNHKTNRLVEQCSHRSETVREI